MEKNSILRLLRFAATRPRSITTSTHHLSAFARRREGLLRYSLRASSSLTSSKRYPTPYCRTPTRFYTTTPDSPADASATSNQIASADGSEKPDAGAEVPQRPTYQLTFTCKPCKHRSTHLVSKLSYHHGAILIQCPGCKARHIISDHLQIFTDQKKTLEDIMNEKGELVKKGRLHEGGDIEFWDEKDQMKSL